VEVVIDQQGVPFSVKSATSLPDNVVQALAKWRFRPGRRNGAPVGYRVGCLSGSTVAAGTDEYKQIRQVWLKHLAGEPKDPVLLNHSSNFLRFSDPATVESALQGGIDETDKAASVPGRPVQTKTVVPRDYVG
jgi:hypothetical protein